MENDNEQDAMKKGCIEETISNCPFIDIYTNECHHAQKVKQHLKGQQEEIRASINGRCHPTFVPSPLNEPQ